MGWIVVLLLVTCCVAYGVWSTTTENGKAYAAKLTAQAADKKAQKLSSQLGKGGRVNARISTVGTKGEVGGLACPRCGGTHFKARRSRAARYAGGATLGVATLLVTKQKQVTCVTCGTRYDRG